MRLILIAAAFAALPAYAADFPPPAPELKALDIQVGYWVYQGTTTDSVTGKKGTFTWYEHCSWSADKLFMMCSFDNDWSGEKVQSLVVNTWNAKDQAYWHYELFAVGAGGDKPFASKMTIRGDTWTELGEEEDHGKRTYDRITYVYTPSRVNTPTNRVTVKIEVSPDRKQWKTVLEGTGTQISRASGPFPAP